MTGVIWWVSISFISARRSSRLAFAIKKTTRWLTNGREASSLIN